MQDHRLTANSGTPPEDPLQPMFDLLAALPDDALMRVRQFIDKTANIDIGSLDLADELGLTYRQGKSLLAQIDTDASIPMNQKAQVFNTVQSQLKQMVEMREQVYSQERLKRFEGALLKVFQALPDDNARHIFFDTYSDYLKDPDRDTTQPELRLTRVAPK